MTGNLHNTATCIAPTEGYLYCERLADRSEGDNLSWIHTSSPGYTSCRMPDWRDLMLHLHNGPSFICVCKATGINTHGSRQHEAVQWKYTHCKVKSSNNLYRNSTNVCSKLGNNSTLKRKNVLCTVIVTVRCQKAKIK